MQIALVDDHPVFRGGLEAILRPDFPSANLVSVGRLQDLDLSITPDVLLLDLLLPDFNPRTDFAGLRQSLPETAIVLFSMVEDGALVQSLLDQGANGFIHKSLSPGTILETLHAVLRGDVVCLPSIAGSGPDEPQLTARQNEVLAGIAKGLTNKEIARDLGISHHTVRFHVSSLLAQLGVGSRSAAAAVARDLLAREKL